MVTLMEKKEEPWKLSKFIICPYCGHEVRYFSYIIRDCSRCRRLLPINPLEIKNNIIQKCVYHFGKEIDA